MVAAATLLPAAGPMAGEILPRPIGAVILTVTGNIESTNSAAGFDFDRASLEELGLTTLSTSTPFTHGIQHFRGVPLHRVLARVGAHGEQAVLSALNGYRAEMPLGDAEIEGVMLAMEMNGETMAVRDKGPLWLVYPLTAEPQLDTRDTRTKMVWQLRRIEIR